MADILSYRAIKHSAKYMAVLVLPLFIMAHNGAQAAAGCGSISSAALTRTEPMKLVTDPTSPTGSYAEIPESLAGDHVGGLKFTGNITATGQFTIRATVWTPDANSDSFYLSVDGGAKQAWHIFTPNKMRQWRTVTWFHPFTLTAGQHTIELLGRERGTRIANVELIPVKNSTGTCTPASSSSSTSSSSSGADIDDQDDDPVDDGDDHTGSVPLCELSHTCGGSSSGSTSSSSSSSSSSSGSSSSSSSGSGSSSGSSSGGPLTCNVNGANKAQMADKIADAVGVNTHINYMDTIYNSGYNNIIKPRLLELGTRHIRDNAGGAVKGRYIELARAGIKLLLVNANRGHKDYAKELNASGVQVVEAVEPPNESDNHSLMGDQGDIKTYMQQMWADYKNDPATRNITVLGPSFAKVNSSALALAARFPDAANFMDAGNMHDYPGGTYPEGPGGGGWGISMAEATARHKRLSGSKPVWTTETGYKLSGAVPGHPAVAEQVAAKWSPRLVLMHLKLGVPRVYFYQLINNREDFGLLNNNGSPRQQFTALKNMINLFKDAGQGFTPGGLDYTVAGDTGGMQQMLFQKRNGKFYYVVWQGVNGEPARKNITLNLRTKISNAVIYEPTFSPNAVRTLNDAAGITSIPLSVPDHIQVVELTPGDCD